MNSHYCCLRAVKMLMCVWVWFWWVIMVETRRGREKRETERREDCWPKFLTLLLCFSAHIFVFFLVHLSADILSFKCTKFQPKTLWFGTPKLHAKFGHNPGKFLTCCPTSCLLLPCNFENFLVLIELPNWCRYVVLCVLWLSTKNQPKWLVKFWVTSKEAKLEQAPEFSDQQHLCSYNVLLVDRNQVLLVEFETRLL